MPEDQDVELDSSTSTLPPEENGTAAVETDASSPPPESRSQDTKPSAPPAPPENPSAKKAIDFLTGADETPPAKDADPAKAVKAPAKPTEAAKAPEKPGTPATPTPLGDQPLTDKEKSEFGRGAQKRIVQLHQRAKEYETKFSDLEAKHRDLEPVAARGRAFDSVVETYGLHQDLGDLNAETGDADVAAAVRFSAAIQRASEGRGTAKVD